MAEAGVQGTIAACVTWLEHKEKRLGVRELLDMQSEGWEIASHSMNHARLTSLPLTCEDEPIRMFPGENRGDHRVVDYPGDRVAGVLENGAPLRRVRSWPNGPKRGTVRLDAQQAALYIAPQDNETDDLRIISAEREILESADELQAKGFDVQTFVAPNNAWSSELRDIAATRFRFACAGADGTPIPLNLLRDRDLLYLHRWSLIWKHPASYYIERMKDVVSQSDAWVIFCVHGLFNDDAPEAAGYDFNGREFGKLFDWIIEQNLEVIPISRASR